MIELSYSVKDVSENCSVWKTDYHKQIFGSKCMDLLSGYGCPIISDCRKASQQLKKLNGAEYDTALANLRENQDVQAGLYRYGYGDNI